MIIKRNGAYTQGINTMVFTTFAQHANELRQNENKVQIKRTTVQCLDKLQISMA